VHVEVAIDCEASSGGVGDLTRDVRAQQIPVEKVKRNKYDDQKTGNADEPLLCSVHEYSTYKISLKKIDWNEPICAFRL